MAKIGKIDTECKFRTSYYLSAGGGKINIKIYLISPIPSKALYNSNDPPPHWQSIFYSPHFTLCWWPSPPPPFTLKNHVTPPIYFFNPLQRLEDMTLIFLSKSSPPPPPA